MRIKCQNRSNMRTLNGLPPSNDQFNQLFRKEPFTNKEICKQPKQLSQYQATLVAKLEAIDKTNAVSH